MWFKIWKVTQMIGKRNLTEPLIEVGGALMFVPRKISKVVTQQFLPCTVNNSPQPLNLIHYLPAPPPG
jgi:hypothetical protein